MDSVSVQRKSGCVVVYLEKKADSKNESLNSTTSAYIETQIPAFLQIDYMGNAYLQYDNSYYVIGLDYESYIGIELVKIKNPAIFRKNLVETFEMVKNVKIGIIHSSNLTLAGKAMDALTNMDGEEKEDFLSANSYMAHDENYYEKKYFRVEYPKDVSDTEEFDDFYSQYADVDNECFTFNGIEPSSEQSVTNNVTYSDLLTMSYGNYETIFIKGDRTSTNVLSSIEKKNGYCAQRLTVYSSGIFRANFIDKSKLARLCVENIDGVIMLVMKEYT